MPNAQSVAPGALSYPKWTNGHVGKAFKLTKTLGLQALVSSPKSCRPCIYRVIFLTRLLQKRHLQILPAPQTLTYYIVWMANCFTENHQFLPGGYRLQTRNFIFRYPT